MQSNRTKTSRRKIVALAIAAAGAVAFAPNMVRADLTYLNSFGFSGSGNGQLNYPQGVTVSPTGIAYVADGNNNRVETFSPTGVSQSTFGTSGSGNGQFSDPSGVAVSSSGTVCVADQINIRVEIFGSTDWTNAASERSLCDIAN